jgi:hypothetical protein
MNSGTTLDILAPFDANCAETEPLDTQETYPGATRTSACELFEGGLGI